MSVKQLRSAFGDPAVTLAVLQAAVKILGPYLVDVLRDVDNRVDETAPVLRETDGHMRLSSPERRLTSGISVKGEEVVPAIFVEREGSWAHSKAESLASEYVSDVAVVEEERPSQPGRARRCPLLMSGCALGRQ